MNVPNFMEMVETSPRDGLQNEKSPIPTDTKVELANRLSEAGLANVGVASFVSPKWVPMMADGTDAVARIRRRLGTLYSVLTPSMRGFEGATAADTNEVVVLSAASEAFTRKNTSCAVAELIERSVPVAKATKDTGIRVCGPISHSLGCLYQGEVPASSMADVIERMVDLGCNKVDIADTIGVGTTGRVKAVMEAAAAALLTDRLSGHFHGTYDQAPANTLASLEVGITISRALIVGLGGCPYTRGAAGNVTTGDVLYPLHGLDIHTGIDLNKVVLAGDFILQAIGRPTISCVGRALLLKLRNQIA